MKRKLLFAAICFIISVAQVKAFTVNDLTSEGWTKVTSLSSVGDYYYVLVDAGTSEYAMGRRSNGNDKPVYMPIADPMSFAGMVWYLGADGDNYTIRSLSDDHFFISGTAGWNDQIADQQWGNEGLFSFAVSMPEGKFSIQSVNTSSYVGPWNNDNKVSIKDGYEDIAANKAANQAPGFYLYSIPRATYNANRITASWLTSHGWSQVTDNGALGNEDNYYLIIEKETFGYAMARTSNGRPASKALSNPFNTKNELWLIAARGSGYSLQNAIDNTYFTSAAGDWNTSMSNTPNADIIATVSDGVYTLSAGGTSNIGHWRDDQYFPYENENIAANKNDANRNSYYIYTISKTDYDTQKASFFSTLAAGATKDAPVNMTPLIFNNSDFATLAKLGWTLSGSAGNQQTTNGSFETWNSNNVAVTQNLAGMPRGKYGLTVQMVSGDAGRVPYLYANGDEEYTATVTQQADHNSYDGMKSDIAASADYGLLSVNPHLSADGTLTVGMKAPSGWVVFDNFKLYYYGKTIKSEAVALPDGGAMEADTWYYIDIAAAADNYTATATTLDDIVFTTDGMTLIENQGSVTDKFKAEDNSLSATRYYVKSNSDNQLEVGVASYSYTVGVPAQSIADGAYISSLSTITFDYTGTASTNDPGATFAILNNSATASLKLGGLTIKTGVLSLDGKVLTATFSDVTLDLASTYTIEIPADVIGYEGNATSEAISTTFKTGSIAEGVYYFKKNDADIYLTRGGWYGTEAVADYFGLSFQAILQTNGKYYLKNIDHSLSANVNKYLNGEGSTYTDSGTPFGWTIEATEGGYYLRPSDTEYMKATYQGEYPYSYLSKTTEVGSAYVWNLLTKAEYATALTAAKNAQVSAIATAAGKSAATVAELEAVLASDFGATDMTSSIQGAALKTADDMTEWTQVKYNGVTFVNADANGICAEVWNSTGGVYQEITSLPAGIYKVTLHATWRPGTKDQGDRVGNEINTTAWMYANTASETNITQLVDWYSTDNSVSSRQAFVDAGEKFVNTTYVYVDEGETLTLGIASPTYCSGAWLPFYGWTLTYYEAKATPAEKTALDDAIDAAEGKTLGFETGEYAPYNNVAALVALATAKAINPETASGKDVVAATTALAGATWTANVAEVNAIRWNIADYPDNNAETKVPTGGFVGSDSNSRISHKSADGGNTGLRGLDQWMALMVIANTNATYGETEGYTMPLKANTVYKLTFKYAGWGDLGTPTVKILNSSSEEVTSTTLAAPTKTGNDNTDAWIPASIIFKTSTAGNYKVQFITSGSRDAFGDLMLKKDALNDRTFSADKWNTLCVPFAFDKADFAEVKELSEIAVDGDHVSMTLNDASTIVAGKPYLVKAKNNGDKITVTNSGDYAAVQESSATASGYTVNFVGTYEGTTVTAATADGNAFVVSNNQLWKVDSDVTVGAYRAYFTVDVPSGGDVKTLSFDELVDGINTVQGAGFKAQDAEIFNLAGQKMSKLQRGVNIVNGKKVLVK